MQRVNYVSSQMLEVVLGPAQHLRNEYQRPLSLGHYSGPYSVSKDKVKNEWSHTSTPLYSFKAFIISSPYILYSLLMKLLLF